MNRPSRKAGRRILKRRVSLDQEISTGYRLALKSLRESERLQDLLDTDETPTDLLTQAKTP